MLLLQCCHQNRPVPLNQAVLSNGQVEQMLKKHDRSWCLPVQGAMRVFKLTFIDASCKNGRKQLTSEAKPRGSRSQYLTTGLAHRNTGKQLTSEAKRVGNRSQQASGVSARHNIF